MRPRVKGKQGTGQGLGLKYIKRQNRGDTQGWYVVFLQRHTRESRFWADRKHGGREQALKKAIAWRDAMMRKLRIPATARRLPVPWTRCSPSGIRGVYLNYHGWAYVTQIAEAPGRYPRAYFGFKTHGGQRSAFIAAVRHRVEQEKRIYGSVVTPLPAWLAAELGVRTSPKARPGKSRKRGAGAAGSRRVAGSRR